MLGEGSDENFRDSVVDFNIKLAEKGNFLFLLKYEKNIVI
jgi:hypothetical protein